VESGPGIFSRRPVKIGREVDGKVLAMGGVNAGERVVTEGCLLLQSMMRAKE
jgi:multidrug efflux pump subunit AcrA (membrane-fusion protein)